jgi:hypothetical protein
MKEMVPSVKLTGCLAELTLYTGMLFLVSQQFQDLIMSKMSYGHGRLLYPFIFAVASLPLYQKIRKPKFSYARIFGIGLLGFWATSSAAMLADAVINQNVWFDVTSGWHSSFSLLTSILAGPWIILTPIIGLVVTLLFKFMLNIQEQ